MSVVLINGSAHKSVCVLHAMNEVAKTLNKNGIKTEIYHLGSKPITGCVGCFQCQKADFCKKMQE